MLDRDAYGSFVSSSPVTQPEVTKAANSEDPLSPSSSVHLAALRAVVQEQDGSVRTIHRH